MLSTQMLGMKGNFKKLENCGWALSNQLKAWRGGAGGKPEIPQVRRKAAPGPPWAPSSSACPAVTVVSQFLKTNYIYTYGLSVEDGLD